MKTPDFEHESTKVAKVIGRDSNVQIIFQGDSARTDGSNIYLPAMPQDADLTTEQVMIGRGYTDHETLHIRETDMGLFSKAVRNAEREGNMLLHATLNAVEDIRIERIGVDKYPGIQKNLEATADAVNKEFLKMAAGDPSVVLNPKAVAAIAITWEGRVRGGYAVGTAGECLGMLPPGLVKSVKEWVDQIDACKSTADSIELAEKITREASSMKTYSAASPSTTGGGTGGGSGGDPDAEGKIIDAEELAHGGSSGSGSHVLDTRKAEIKAKDTVVPVGIDIAKAFNIASGKNRSGVWRPFSTGYDTWRSYENEPHMQEPTNDRRFDVLQKELMGPVGVMRRKIEKALVAKQVRAWRGGHLEGRLDPRALIRARRMEEDVYRNREEVDDIDTAVAMLVDLSGSMSGHKARIAAQAAIALGLAIDKARVPWAVYGFNNRGPACGHDAASREVWREAQSKASSDPTNYGFSRWETLDMYEFKSFDQTVRTSRRSLATISDYAGGNNTDGEAVLKAWLKLAKRQERRKVFIVLSDGHPAASTSFSSSHLNWHLKKVVQEIEAMKDVSVVGIGICDESPKQFYKRHVCISNVAELSGTVLDQLGRMMLGEKFQADNRKLAA